MTRDTMNPRWIVRAAYSPLLVLSLLSCGCASIAIEPANLALNKPAYSSSIENDEHTAAQANDGDPETSWRADDEPEDGPEWWLVDLEKPLDLSGCQIRWPYEGQRYRYKVEGSADRKSWLLLCDQTNNTSAAQEHNLKFPNARQVRYVRVTVTGFDEGCWASICEVRIFGDKQVSGPPVRHME